MSRAALFLLLLLPLSGCLAVGSPVACLTAVETYVESGLGKSKFKGVDGLQSRDRAKDFRAGISLYWDLTGECEPEPVPPKAPRRRGPRQR